MYLAAELAWYKRQWGVIAHTYGLQGPLFLKEEEEEEEEEEEMIEVESRERKLSKYA